VSRTSLIYGAYRLANKCKCRPTKRTKHTFTERRERGHSLFMYLLHPRPVSCDLQKCKSHTRFIARHTWCVASAPRESSLGLRDRISIESATELPHSSASTSTHAKNGGESLKGNFMTKVKAWEVDKGVENSLFYEDEKATRTLADTLLSFLLYMGIFQN